MRLSDLSIKARGLTEFGVPCSVRRAEVRAESHGDMESQVPFSSEVECPVLTTEAPCARAERP